MLSNPDLIKQAEIIPRVVLSSYRVMTNEDIYYGTLRAVFNTVLSVHCLGSEQFR